MSKPTLVQVHVVLPNHPLAQGEILWALPVEDGHELHNVPFYAYGLNFRDVVEVEANDRGVLHARRVVRPSGHRTMRLILAEDVSNRARKKLRRALDELGVSIEEGSERFLAIDLPPELDFEEVRDLLDDFEEDGVLEYETCQERVPGSFDDAPGLQLP